jgi:hypothetical protein
MSLFLESNNAFREVKVNSGSIVFDEIQNFPFFCALNRILSTFILNNFTPEVAVYIHKNVFNYFFILFHFFLFFFIFCLNKYI